MHNIVLSEEQLDQYLTKIQRFLLSLIASLYVEKMTQIKISTVNFNKEMNLVHRCIFFLLTYRQITAH